MYKEEAPCRQSGRHRCRTRPMKESKSSTRYRFRFQRDPNLPTNLAHGVWGGINQQGEIEMNFFTESEDMPEYVERLVMNDGTIVHEEVSNEGAETRMITRTVTDRVIISYETGRALVEWLEDQLNMLDEIENTGEDPRDSFLPFSKREQ